MEPFCRTQAPPGSSSRGVLEFSTLFETLSKRSAYESDASGPSGAPHELEELATCALSVDPNWISLPPKEASRKPENHMTEPYRKQFCELLITTRPVECPLRPGTRPWHKIDPSSERLLAQQLLAENMAVLLSEGLIPTDSDGHVLRGGLFCIKHKLSSDRL